MIKLRFKTRLALFYLAISGFIMAVAYLGTYLTVQTVLYENIDHDLATEARKHAQEVIIENGEIRFAHKDEWVEREHHQAQVNPVFIQIVGLKGRVLDKSPNLKDQALPFLEHDAVGQHRTTQLNDKSIRIAQVPLKNKEGQPNGYVLTAMSLQSTLEVLQLLRYVMFMSYPVMLLILFLSSRYIAGQAIRPMVKITEATHHISQNNLSQRVPLPERSDEVAELGLEINAMLDRLQAAMQRERQFTNDASHQLRTPLTALRGQLEVLLRKERAPQEYHRQLSRSLQQIDQMTAIVERLLELAREGKLSSDEVPLDSILHRLKQRYEGRHSRGLVFDIPAQEWPALPQMALDIILDNFMDNAIRYSPPDKPIEIKATRGTTHWKVAVRDSGPGLNPEEKARIFQPFYRARLAKGKGTGLGLSIAQRAASAIGATLDVSSQPGLGSTFTVEGPLI